MKIYMKTNCLQLLVAILLLAGCRHQKTSSNVATVKVDSVAVVDTTVYGVCGDGCAMHTLQLLTDGGDTIDCMLESSDGSVETEVKGGMSVGDRVGAVLQRDADGSVVALSAVNLTSLMGKWGSLELTFRLNPDGTVVGDMKEPHPYTQWKMCNGKLVLPPDTFDVVALGHDTLSIRNVRETMHFKRISK